MNESKLARRAWQSINHDIWVAMYDYFEREEYPHIEELEDMKVYADKVCDYIDELERVSEWLEKKFE